MILYVAGLISMVLMFLGGPFTGWNGSPVLVSALRAGLMLWCLASLVHLVRRTRPGWLKAVADIDRV